jgi:hypothetical protein
MVSIDDTIFLPLFRSIAGLCANHQWHHDLVSPVDNLFDKPDDLDPQPEYPLRSELGSRKQEDQPAPSLNVLREMRCPWQGHAACPRFQYNQHRSKGAIPNLRFSFIFCLPLWVFG